MRLSKKALLVAAVLGATTASVHADGKATYETTCSVCHATGVANAPKFGDKAAWKDRIAKGMDTLYTHALKGFNAMPPKGGNMALSDADVKAAVDYMVSKAK
jgi:cytochrome c5